MKDILISKDSKFPSPSLVRKIIISDDSGRQIAMGNVGKRKIPAGMGSSRDFWEFSPFFFFFGKIGVEEGPIPLLSQPYFGTGKNAAPSLPGRGSKSQIPIFPARFFSFLHRSRENSWKIFPAVAAIPGGGSGSLRQRSFHSHFLNFYFFSFSFSSFLTPIPAFFPAP